ncbi:hypothetical protein NG701_14370 [Pseudarthrobacter sp. HLT3-5]|uniref:hypothetical protein n=1 Tax=Pseudarthrobacter cellobiosi TaxID=2953654 RepID=UPI00208E857B|nr:hypothetical protein [Pseudarthrobacter sp. HLT3-5]MCO4275599.1 hypothetical protein [Pseudarthrobacter sp. HLT3-5]
MKGVALVVRDFLGRDYVSDGLDEPASEGGADMLLALPAATCLLSLKRAVALAPEATAVACVSVVMMTPL